MNRRFPPPILASASCGWKLDLRSHILFSPDPFENHDSDARPFWLSTYQHEVAHWVRLQTSSIGILLSALQRARGLTAYKALQLLDRPTRERIVNEAFEGKPIWTYDTGYDPDLGGADFGLSGQFWLDQRFFYQTLLDPSTLGSMPYPAEAFSCAFADAWLACAPFPGMLSHPGNSVAEKILFGSMQRIEAFGHELTTRSLWECASSLDELRPFSAPSKKDWQDQIKLVNYKLEDPTYGAPWYVANRLSYGGTSPAMFHIAVHIATNPPLPFWDENLNSLSWQDLYPPARFLRVYEYIGRYPSVMHDILAAGPEKGVETVLRMILEETEIPYAKPSIVETLLLEESPSLGQPVVGDINYVIRMSLALRFRWVDKPARFIYPSISTIDTFRGNDELWDLLFTNKLARPPMMQFSDGVHSTGLLTPDQNGIYCTWAFMRNSLESLLVGEGMPDQVSYLPDSFCTQENRSNLSRHFFAPFLEIHWDG